MPDLRSSYPILRVKNLADSTQAVELSADSSGRIITLSNSHFKIHQGDYYGVGYYNSSVANGSSIQVILEIPSTITAHTSIKVKHGGDATLQVYENVTYTAAGTSITPQNHNRCFSNSSPVTASHTPTGATGTLIWQEYFAGGTGGVTPGGVATIGEQVVLCSSTIYMFEITNTSGIADALDLVLSYYEVAV